MYRAEIEILGRFYILPDGANIACAPSGSSFALGDDLFIDGKKVGRFFGVVRQGYEVVDYGDDRTMSYVATTTVDCMLDI